MAILVWGCPPFARVDGPLRAAKAAIDLFASLTALVEAAACVHVLGMGITTGRAFAGNVGSASRCEYSVLGTCVNLAARLMGVAYKLGGGIVSDHATCKFVRNGWSGVEVGPEFEVNVKGAAKALKVATLASEGPASPLPSGHQGPAYGASSRRRVSAARPFFGGGPSLSQEEGPAGPPSDMRGRAPSLGPGKGEELFVCRDAEFAELVALFRACGDGSCKPQAVAYSAQYGVGKSALLRAGAAWLTREMPDVGICWVFGDDFMRDTPWFAFQMPWMLQLVQSGIPQVRPPPSPAILSTRHMHAGCNDRPVFRHMRAFDCLGAFRERVPGNVCCP